MLLNRDNIFEYINKKFQDLTISKGSLYLVSTPIGNLDDISFRALFVLKNVDLIASEDTRITGFLLSQFGIKQKITSYYSQTEKIKVDFIINELKSGKSCALVSDAGTPCISDPGNIIVNECIKNNINVFPVPGASSLIHSLILSGFNFERFYFQGFLPQKKGRNKTLDELKNIKMPIVIFESKYRVKKTLFDLLNHLGNLDVVICRELTKKFEEIKRGRLKCLLSINNSFKEKGEFVIIIDNH